MNAEETFAWLDRVAGKGSGLGLERMRVLVNVLGDPQNRLKIVHIAGTNGKGSVMTFLEHTLLRAGYHVGRYLSPAVFGYAEKFRLDEKEIREEEFCALAGEVRAACERMEAAGEETPTIFEVETALAFLFFERNACDVVLLETGMGGETDATNVADATILEIFSSISADHMEFLGDTVEKIAAVKAGILKRGSIAVSAPQSPGVAAVLQSRANALGVPLTFADPARIREVCYGLTAQRVCYETAVSFGTKTRGGRLHDLTIGMGGNWQVTNAITALEAVEALRALGFALGEEALRQGFEEAFIGGRFEVVQTEPTVIMDGAHNPEAVLGLKASLAASFPPQTRFLFVMGVFADKDYREEIALMAPLARRIYTVQTKDNARALDADKLAQAVRKVNPNVVSVGDVPRALSMALAEAGKNDVILLFGSLSWLGEARAFFDGRLKS